MPINSYIPPIHQFNSYDEYQTFVAELHYPAPPQPEPTIASGSFHSVTEPPPLHAYPTVSEWTQSVNLSGTAYSFFKKKKEPKEVKKSGYRYNVEVFECFAATHGKQKAVSGKVGLEIECEGTDLWNNPFSYWVCKPDGSLRTYKGHPPIEYVLTTPKNRSDLDEAFAYLEAGLKKAGSVVIESPRTSVHVHINQQQKTLRKVFTYLCGYLILEDILVRWAGEDREGNTFCLRAKDAEYFIWLLEEAIKKDSYYELVNQEMRYTSCNVASLSKFGSLEFRALRGTVDSRIILAWVDILLDLEAVCDRYSSPQELLVEIERVLTNYGGESVVRYLLPKTCGKVLPYPDTKSTIWKSLRRVKDVAYAIPVWKDEKPVRKVKKIQVPDGHGGATMTDMVTFGDEENND